MSALESLTYQMQDLWGRGYQVDVLETAKNPTGLRVTPGDIPATATFVAPVVLMVDGLARGALLGLGWGYKAALSWTADALGVYSASLDVTKLVAAPH